MRTPATPTRLRGRHATAIGDAQRGGHTAVAVGDAAAVGAATAVGDAAAIGDAAAVAVTYKGLASGTRRAGTNGTRLASCLVHKWQTRPRLATRRVASSLAS